jgi:CBS domain-containing protein
MKCQEIMKRDVEFVLEDSTVLDAARRMRDANIGFLPVSDQANKIVGTLTDRDITIRVAAENRPAAGVRAAEVMSRDVVTCRPGSSLEEAERLMGLNQKSRIVITNDEGILEGVISLSDIVDHETHRRAAVTMRQVSARESRL